MNCENHPDKEGVAACVSCGKILCEDCRLKLAGKNYCQDCADELVSAKTEKVQEEPENPPSSGRIADRYQKGEYQDRYGEERHRGMPRPEPQRVETKKGSNTFLLFCVAFIVALVIIGVILYAVYIVYLAPYYGDVQNVINVLMNDPQRIINFLSTQ